MSKLIQFTTLLVLALATIAECLQITQFGTLACFIGWSLGVVVLFAAQDYGRAFTPAVKFAAVHAVAETPLVALERKSTLSDAIAGLRARVATRNAEKAAGTVMTFGNTHSGF